MKNKIEIHLIKKLTKALKDFKMITSGDIIAVALSGGKDSFTLLDLLWKRKKHISIKYDIVGIHIDYGLNKLQTENIKKFCFDRDIKLYIKNEKIEFFDNKKNKCFYCSYVRRNSLFRFVKELNIKKLAFGHHSNDIAETIFLNLMYQGKFESFLPNTSFFNGGMFLIRPLIYCKNDDILEYSNIYNIPFLEHFCPFENGGERNKIRQFLNTYTNKEIIKNILNSWLNNIKNPYYQNRGLVI